MLHYPDLGSASDLSCHVGNLIQPIRSTTQIGVVTHHRYGISVLVSQTSFGCSVASLPRRRSQGFVTRSWGRNKSQTPKNVCVRGYSVATCRQFSQAKVSLVAISFYLSLVNLMHLVVVEVDILFGSVYVQAQRHFFSVKIFKKVVQIGGSFF